MCGEFDWAAYPYVILIVSGAKHYSLLVVENLMQNGPTGMFHVNSLKGAHASAYVFNMMRWHFANERHKYPDLTYQGTYAAGVFDTKPQQSNCVDCGLYVLHYIEKIGKDILELQETSTTTVPSVQEDLATWTSGSFTARSAAKRRNVRYQKITDAASITKT
ncbi:unnamed protein product [Phytophthora fragariaefolia]|uniref:Unnamed protein product n=1 Tax=Phytophthora fragariaefolia TaxID=1490495 RepID=A0A9W6XWX4_9STRA|nr:unnamed protein product [Phytophthora fragariaefolia]